MPSGSTSTSTRGGLFSLGGFPWENFALHGSTDDGKAAILTGVDAGRNDLIIRVEPGGFLEIELVALERLRCAVLRDGLRVEDFTLRGDQPIEVVLPPGEFVVRLCGGDRVHHERHVQVAVGESRSIVL